MDNDLQQALREIDKNIRLIDQNEIDAMAHRLRRVEALMSGAEPTPQESEMLGVFGVTLPSKKS